MVLPLLLIIVAGVALAIVGYGADPGLMHYAHGLDIILWTRRLEWPLVAVAIICSILLIALAIANRRRGWWLLGLAPVLALFLHRFTVGAGVRPTIIENPTFAAPAQAAPRDDDWVVGVDLGDETFAYPYAALYHAPVLIQPDHDRRIMLLWSAYANRVKVLPIEHDLHGRDLEIVSSPADALLLYDSRTGQFINGLTGQTTAGTRPQGVGGGREWPACKMPWKQWIAAHPQTKVLQTPNADRSPAPTQPIQPAWAAARTSPGDAASVRVAVVGSADPVAVKSEQLTAAPLNTHADDMPIVMFREQPDWPIRAYDRRLLDEQGKLDLILDLAPNLRPQRHPLALLVDLGSNSGWNADGVCVDAPTNAKYLKGKHLRRVAVDDNLPIEVMKFWMPKLRVEIAPAAPIAVETDAADAPAKLAGHHRPHKPKPVAQ